jgi:hypothetical protein
MEQAKSRVAQETSRKAEIQAGATALGAKAKRLPGNTFIGRPEGAGG